jgi:hypothetical protein
MSDSRLRLIEQAPSNTDPDPAFEVNSDSDPGFCDQKLEEKNTAEIFFIFF